MFINKTKTGFMVSMDAAKFVEKAVRNNAEAKIYWQSGVDHTNNWLIDVTGDIDKIYHDALNLAKAG